MVFTIYGEEKPILHLFQRGSYAFFCEKHVSKIMKIINRNCSEMTKMNTVFKCRVGVTVTSCYGKESETVLYLYIILTRVSSYDCCWVNSIDQPWLCNLWDLWMIERQQSCIWYCASDDDDSHGNYDDHHHHGYDGDAGDGFEDERWLWLPIKCRYVQLIEKNKGENWFSILSASKIWWYEIFWNYLEITLSFSLLVTTANHYWLSQLPPDCFCMVIMGTSKEDTGGFDKDGHELINFLGWFDSVGLSLA